MTVNSLKNLMCPSIRKDHRGVMWLCQRLRRLSIINRFYKTQNRTYNHFLFSFIFSIKGGILNRILLEQQEQWWKGELRNKQTNGGDWSVQADSRMLRGNYQWTMGLIVANIEVTRIISGGYIWGEMLQRSENFLCFSTGKRITRRKNHATLDKVNKIILDCEWENGYHLSPN